MLNSQITTAQHIEREKAYNVIASLLQIPFLDEEVATNTFHRKMSCVDGCNTHNGKESPYTWTTVTESECVSHISVGHTLHGKDGAMKHRGCSLEEEDEWEHLRNEQQLAMKRRRPLSEKGAPDLHPPAAPSRLLPSPFQQEERQHQRKGRFPHTGSHCYGPGRSPPGSLLRRVLADRPPRYVQLREPGYVLELENCVL